MKIKSEGNYQELSGYRSQIDNIDDQILSLLAKRMDFCSAIGKVKNDQGIEPFDIARQTQILMRLTPMKTKNLTPEAIRRIFTEIFSASRAVQEAFVIAYLGPEATFCHQAAASLFGHSGTFRPAETIEDIFRLVDKSHCKQGVVPIENSYEGPVVRTLDLFYQYNLKICGEIFLRIRHNLISKADTIEKIKYIYSNPMAIAQCWSWIKKRLPHVSIIETDSTSRAAQLTAEKMDSGAIGSNLVAQQYNLNILEEDIEEHPQNITRFVAIGKSEARPTERNKTSIIFSLSDKPGSLYRILDPLSVRNINMTRIESRPNKMKNWEYIFFVDLDGHVQESNISEALREMESHCVFIKLLGSYPAGEEIWS